MGAFVVLVAGSRDWMDEATIDGALSGCWAKNLSVEVLHGGARGADLMAASVARCLGFTVRAFPADWKTHGKRAGILRNLAMLDEKPDLVIAFQRNGSRGTQHVIDEARRRGIPVEIHTCP